MLTGSGLDRCDLFGPEFTGNGKKSQGNIWRESGFDAQGTRAICGVTLRQHGGVYGFV